MRTLRNNLRIVAWMLTGLILFQSCVVYHKTPRSLEEASQLQTKTKITQKDGDTFKYNYISFEDGMFYGIDKKSGELIKTPLDENLISLVLTMNKKASTGSTIAAIVVPIVAVAVIIYLSIENMNIGAGFTL